MAATDNKAFETLVGERLREFREQKNMTQDHLAEKCGISIKTYGRIERGEVTANIKAVYKICSALGITMGDIFDTIPDELIV